MPLIIWPLIPKPVPSGTIEQKTEWFLAMLCEVRRRAGHRWAPLKEGAFDVPRVICLYTFCLSCGIYIHMYPEEPHLYFQNGTGGLQFGFDIPDGWKPKVCDKLASFV
jgi:hypothetical protein